MKNTGSKIEILMKNNYEIYRKVNNLNNETEFRYLIIKVK